MNKSGSRDFGTEKNTGVPEDGRRGRYTLESEPEAVRLVESAQSIADAARSLGVIGG